MSEPEFYDVVHGTRIVIPRLTKERAELLAK